MAKAIWDWSITPNSNATADSTVNAATGALMSTGHPALRNMMARARAFITALAGIVSAGSSNAYTYANPTGHTWSALPSTAIIAMKASFSNSGAATLNVDGIGAVAIKKGDGATALVTGDIVSGGYYWLMYDGVTGFWNLLNPGFGGISTFQPLDADLTAFAALTQSASTPNIRGTGVASFALMSDANLLTTLSGVPTSRTITAGGGLTGGGDLSANRTLAVDAASAANFRAKTTDKVLDADGVWDASDTVTLTDAATIAVDMSTFINAKVTLGGNRTLGQPSSVKNGQSGCIEIIQDGTGSRTLAYHADWLFAGGTDPTLSTTAGAKDLLFYQVMSNGKTYGTLVKAIA